MKEESIETKQRLLKSINRVLAKHDGQPAHDQLLYWCKSMKKCDTRTRYNRIYYVSLLLTQMQVVDAFAITGNMINATFDDLQVVKYKTEIGEDGEVKSVSYRQDATQSTKWAYLNALSGFLKKTYRDNDKTMPESLIDDLKNPYTVAKRIDNNDEDKKAKLLTDDEVKAMLDATKSIEIKAMIAVLYDCGFRSSELLSMKYSNAKRMVDTDGIPYYDLSINDSKTKKRTVSTYYAVDYIDGWIIELKKLVDKRNDIINRKNEIIIKRNKRLMKKNEHEMPLLPTLDISEVGLWTVDSNRNVNLKNMSHTALFNAIKQTAHTAGVDVVKIDNKQVKKFTGIHGLRHVCATKLADYAMPADMNDIMGWVDGSNTWATYVHTDSTALRNIQKRKSFEVNSA